MRVKVLVLVAVLTAWTGTAMAQEPVPPDPGDAPPAQQEEEKLSQEQEIEKLVGELGSDNWSVREAATKKLIKIGLPAAEAVEKLAESEDIEIRVRAKKILDALHYVSRADREKIEKEIERCLWGESKPLDEATKKLISDLSSDDWQTREDAVKKLIAKGPSVLKELEKLLDTDDPDLKDRLENIVKKIREKAKKQFQEQLKKSIETLKTIKSSSYHLVETLATKSAKPREDVVAKLLAGILDLKGDDDTDNIIPGRGGVVVGKVVVIIQGGKKRVIINGEEVTGLGKNPSADKVLSFVAKDEKKDVELRVEAVKTLKAREAVKAVANLVKLLGKSGGELQLETAKTLRKLTGRELGPVKKSTLEETQKALEEWKKWWDENKKDKKYRFTEQPVDDDNSDMGLGLQKGPMKALRKQMKEMLKKNRALTEEARKQLEKVLGKDEDKEKEAEKKEDGEKKAEPEKKPEEPKKEEKPSEPQKEGGEGKKSRDF